MPSNVTLGNDSISGRAEASAFRSVEPGAALDGDAVPLPERTPEGRVCQSHLPNAIARVMSHTAQSGCAPSSGPAAEGGRAARLDYRVCPLTQGIWRRTDPDTAERHRRRQPPELIRSPTVTTCGPGSVEGTPRAPRVRRTHRHKALGRRANADPGRECLAYPGKDSQCMTLHSM